MNVPTTINQLPTLTLNIGNMVCDRCVATVSQLATKHGFQPQEISLGRVSLLPLDSHTLLEPLIQELESHGFTYIQDPLAKLALEVKQAIMQLIRSGGLADMSLNMSTYLEQELGRDYSTITHQFTAQEGLTIERYTILQRVEYAKELLQDTTMPIQEIADLLGYSSPAYLSNQFKQLVGYTPLQYRQQKPQDRVPLDLVGKL